MPRRTGIDTLFDNENTLTGPELREMSEFAEDPINRPLDVEDIDQVEEGLPGEFGNYGERDDDIEEMDDEDYENAVSQAISNAEDFIDMELSPDRELAARYYRGDEFGNEVEGRSRVVMTEVRDTVLAVMPSLLRIFCGTADAVEFINSIATPQAQADAQTAYVNHIIHKDNHGFTIFHSAFKDALVRKTGIFTWWHEEKETVTVETHTGLNEQAFALLQLEKEEASSEDEHISYHIDVLDERVDTTAPSETPLLLGEEDPAALDPNMPPPVSFIRDVRVRKVVIKKRHKVAAVPPEEFICAPTSSDDIDEYPLVGRRQMKTIGELVALGHSEEEIREAIEAGNNGGSSLQNNAEVVDRNGAQVERIFDTGFEDVDPASEMVKYVVAYILIDKDGDGIIERRKVVTVGDNHKIIYDEIVDEMVPFALICPDPEPHSPFGYSLADQTMDMQDIKSEMMRGVLDSLAESIEGRTAILEGQVNIDDALSNERGRLIRIKQVGAIQDMSTPFVGMNAMPVFDYLDNVKARRTGITMAPAGLAADTLQSTSTDAVNAVVDASQERAEMIARIFAETGIKRLFRGLLQQVVKHQDPKRLIRLRGKPITVDPRAFVADLDLETNVGLGRGTAAKKLQGLTAIIGKQQEILEKHGFDNPFVQLHKVSNAIEDWVHEIGFNDAGRYFTLMDETAAAEFMKRQAEKQQPPSPEEILAQVQREKNASQEKIAQIRAMVDVFKMEAKARGDADKLEQDFYLKAAEILGKFGIQVNEAEISRAREDEDKADELAREAQTGAQAALAPPQGSTP